MARENKINTRLEIIETATRLFLERGYTNVTVSAISSDLGISKGNFTFHFPTKEHVLAELTKQLIVFQWEMLRLEMVDGYSPQAAYLLEITSLASSCYESEVARDLYVSAYTSPMSLRLIRNSDTEKAQRIFKEYNPKWTEVDFRLAENLVSGVEYSMFTTEREQGIPLDKKIAYSLDAILRLYNVPEDERREMLHKVLSVDYRTLGMRLFYELGDYVRGNNARALAEVVKRREVKDAADHKKLTDLRVASR